ncbi:MAG TPA: hypothetical protein VIJ06_08590, partial [Methylovirgula sp.]
MAAAQTRTRPKPGLATVQSSSHEDGVRIAGSSRYFVTEELGMSAIEARLQSLNVTLPAPAAPVANYVAYVIAGNLLVVSGQLAFGNDGKLAPDHIGKVGGAVSVE